MFTVKHYQINGEHQVYSCDYYVVTPPHIPVAAGEQPTETRISLFDPDPRGNDCPQASKVCIFVDEGESAFIENDKGHTVDVVRPVGLAGERSA